MTPADLRAVGTALYGLEWQSPMARALGVNPRTIRRLVAGESPISPGMEADIRRLTGATDALDPDRAWPRDEWIVGDGPGQDGERREYLVHGRMPRFVARIAYEGDATPADRGTGVTYGCDGYTLCEIVWIDAPPGPAALARLMERACDAVDAAT